MKTSFQGGKILILISGITNLFRNLFKQVLQK